MTNPKIETQVVRREKDRSHPTPGEAKQPGYRTPELHEIGDLELMQGRNYYRDKDAGNSNYYI
jgi:hypothetical protein